MALWGVVGPTPWPIQGNVLMGEEMGPHGAKFLLLVAASVPTLIRQPE